LLGGTNNNPEDVEASKPGNRNNFTRSSPRREDDALTFNLSGRDQVNRVKHLLDISGILIGLTSGGEWSVGGDSAGILRPGKVNPVQHGYVGAGDIAPVVIGGNALYVQERGSQLHDLKFTIDKNGYFGDDLTTFASHLFDNFTIKDLAYERIPHSLVWAPSSSGKLLGLTYIPTQEIQGWHRHDWLDGDNASQYLAEVENVAVIPEGNESITYVCVKYSNLGGRVRRYNLRMATRLIDQIEDLITVDAALSFDGEHTGSTTMTLSGGTLWDEGETLTLTASAPTFTSAAEDEGNQIHLNFTNTDGKRDQLRFDIDTFSSTT